MRTTYVHDNIQLVLDKGQGIVYNNDRLVFKGNLITSIRLFIQETNNDEGVVEKFRKQLEAVEERSMECNNTSSPTQTIGKHTNQTQ